MTVVALEGAAITNLENKRELEELFEFLGFRILKWKFRFWDSEDTRDSKSFRSYHLVLSETVRTDTENRKIGRWALAALCVHISVIDRFVNDLISGEDGATGRTVNLEVKFSSFALVFCNNFFLSGIPECRTEIISFLNFQISFTNPFWISAYFQSKPPISLISSRPFHLPITYSERRLEAV